MSPVVEIKDMTRAYRGEPTVHALAGIDLQIDAGEMLAVVGPSGSGKSTLLNIIGTLDRPTTGTVAIEGVETSTLSDQQLAGLRAARLGFVFQAFHLLDTLTALDNVANGLLYRGAPTDERRDRALLALERVGLADRTDTKPAKLSGGERQRVAIARAIVAEPAIILADEPTGNLDTEASDDLMGLLNDLNTAGSTIVVITHNLDIAAAMPRLVRLRDGHIDQDTTALGADR